MRDTSRHCLADTDASGATVNPKPVRERPPPIRGKRAAGYEWTVQAKKLAINKGGPVDRRRERVQRLEAELQHRGQELRCTGCGTTEQADIAFKVDSRGRAVPKSGEEIANPYISGKYLWQRDRFNKMIIFAGHQLAQ